MRQPIGFVQTRTGWSWIYTSASRYRHVLDGHPIHAPCICGKGPAYMRGWCLPCWRKVRPVELRKGE